MNKPKFKIRYQKEIRYEVLLSIKIPLEEHVISEISTNVSSGVYVYKSEAGEFVETKKLVLLK